MKINSDATSKPTTAIDVQKHAKLIDAAEQFEAAMLQELLKPLQHRQNSWGGEEKNDDTASDTISSFGTEAIAKVISRGGGFGIAKQIVSKVMLESQQISEKRVCPSTRVSGFHADTFK
jgi:Rod binding domain-containing protein